MMAGENDADVIEREPIDAGEGDGDPGGADGRASQQRQALEEIAREQGWRPRNEYEKLPNANPDKWVDAGEFLKRGETQMPILRDMNRKLQREVREMKDLMGDLVKNQKAQTQAAVERAITALKRDKKAAVAEGNVDRVEEIDGQIESLQASTAEPTDRREKHSETTEVPGEYSNWAKKNQWFNKDPVLTREAISALDVLNADPETSELSDNDKLELVTRRVRTLRPERFPAAPKRQPSAVESGGNAPRSNGRGHSWADLPAEHRDIGDRLIKAGAVKDRNAYLSSYQWE